MKTINLYVSKRVLKQRWRPNLWNHQGHSEVQTLHMVMKNLTTEQGKSFR